MKRSERYFKEYQRVAEDDLNCKISKHKEVLKYKPIIKMIGDTEFKEVLDLACGDGGLLLRIKALKKVGCDIAEPYLKKAKLKGIDVFYHNIEHKLKKKLNFDPDIVLLTSVLEHVLNPKKVINNIKEILHDYTSVFVLVPYKEDLSVYDNCGYEFAHLRTFDEESIKLLFDGFYLEQYNVITPKNIFVRKKGVVNIILCKLFFIVFVPQPITDFIFIKCLGIEGSILIAEFKKMD